MTGGVSLKVKQTLNIAYFPVHCDGIFCSSTITRNNYE